MKHLPFFVAAILLSVLVIAPTSMAASAQDTPLIAPKTLTSPDAILTKSTCLVIYECGQAVTSNSLTPPEASKAILDEISNGDWLRFGSRDTEWLTKYGWMYNGRYDKASGSLVCPVQTSTGQAEMVFDNNVIVELWYPGCNNKMPEVCTDYNDSNIISLGESTTKSTSTTDYLFVDSNRNSYFKGAGFYAGCKSSTFTYGKNSGLVLHKILVAAGTKAALKEVASDFAKVFEKTSLSSYSPLMKNYNSEDWTSYAVVYFKEDEAAKDALLSKKASLQNALLIKDGESLGKYAQYFNSPGDEGPDSKLIVLTSADVAMQRLKENRTDSLAYQLFALIMKENPDYRVVNSTAYGCQRFDSAKSSLFSDFTKLIANDVHILTVPQGTYSPNPANNTIYAVQEKSSGKVLVGARGFLCGFDGSKKAGYCQASIQGGSSSDISLTKTCNQDNPTSGNIADYGIVWKDTRWGGILDPRRAFISGLTARVTSLMAEGNWGDVGSAEYFKAKSYLFPSCYHEVPQCKDLKSTDCPYKYADSKPNGATDNWCACVQLGDADKQLESSIMQVQSIAPVGGGVVVPPAQQTPTAVAVAPGQCPPKSVLRSEPGKLNTYSKNYTTDVNALIEWVKNQETSYDVVCCSEGAYNFDQAVIQSGEYYTCYLCRKGQNCQSTAAALKLTTDPTTKLTKFDTSSTADIYFTLSRALNQGESITFTVDNGASPNTPSLTSGSQTVYWGVISAILSGKIYTFKILVNGVALKDASGKDSWTIDESATGPAIDRTRPGGTSAGTPTVAQQAAGSGDSAAQARRLTAAAESARNAVASQPLTGAVAASGAAGASLVNAPKTNEQKAAEKAVDALAVTKPPTTLPTIAKSPSLTPQQTQQKVTEVEQKLQQARVLHSRGDYQGASTSYSQAATVTASLGDSDSTIRYTALSNLLKEPNTAPLLSTLLPGQYYTPPSTEPPLKITAHASKDGQLLRGVTVTLMTNDNRMFLDYTGAAGTVDFLISRETYTVTRYNIHAYYDHRQYQIDLNPRTETEVWFNFNTPQVRS